MHEIKQMLFTGRSQTPTEAASGDFPDTVTQLPIFSRLSNANQVLSNQRHGSKLGCKYCIDQEGAAPQGTSGAYHQRCMGQISSTALLVSVSAAGTTVGMVSPLIPSAIRNKQAAFHNTPPGCQVLPAMSSFLAHPCPEQIQLGLKILDIMFVLLSSLYECSIC